MGYKHVLGLSVAAVWAFATPVMANTETNTNELDVSIANVEGTYAGTFFCSVGEMGMTLSLKDAGDLDPNELAIAPCRSGSGVCNDRHAAAAKGKRKTVGVLNFFPTVSNPNAPKGAFRVSGWVDYNTSYFNKLEMSPGEWLNQPKKFGASAMTGIILDGEISGKPTAPGCHSLTMQKIITGD